MFKITFRYLWRQILFTALSILGLAIGISACWVIYSIVSYEFSFEKDLPNKESIYRLVSAYEYDGKESYMGGVSKPIYQGIREQVTGVERVVPVFGQFFKRYRMVDVCISRGTSCWSSIVNSKLPSRESCDG